jgi:diaminohydroxyphosphoribosylaminopyrimidine deaminase/5-amino-6-(5-phosphoribosylamino)uracil reductase
MFSTDDHRHMSRALQLAGNGLFTTQPNPRVGCLLVRNNRVVGEGWHQYAGGPHAEIVALRKSGVHAEGATAYVTLEPCAHAGKTPPCVDSLVQQHVTRVVVAMPDPNPLVNGTGIERLRAAGIQVDVGLMEDQARALNPGFIQRMTRQRPYIRLKSAISLDGRTALADGSSYWITGENSRIDVQRFRARSSAIMTGIDTVLTDDPAMTVRLESLAIGGDLAEEIIPHISQPLRIVLDSRLRMPPQARMLQLPGDVLIVTTCVDSDKQRALASDHVEVVCLPADARGKPNLNDLMSILAAGEINELMVESGSRLAGALLSAKLVDEIVLYIAPCLLGSDAKGLINIPALADMQSKFNLDILDLRPIDNDIRIIAKPAYQN